MADTNPADWITAAATVATAFIAYLGFRAHARRDDPAVETSHSVKDGYLIISATFRNFLHESLSIAQIDVRKPKGALVTIKREYGEYGSAMGPAPGQSGPITANYIIAPFGYPGSMASPSDTRYMPIFVFPPAGWSGGKVVISIDLVGMASSKRYRRWVTLRLKRGINSTKSEAKTSVAGAT